MFSRSFSAALRFAYPKQRLLTRFTAKCSTATEKKEDQKFEGCYFERDPAPHFFAKSTQALLRSLTRAQPDKVFRRQLDSRRLEPPRYEFMTDEQLDNALRRADDKMWQRLQMPPVLKVREEDSRVFAEDPALEGFSEHKYVFTDITFGVSNKDRLIYVREPSGRLRAATNEERDRMNQIYFPIKGREVEVPRMFQDEHLELILDREDYDFILNRACIQFDPDHELYHKTTQLTYDRIDEKLHHDRLRSTRHYGPLVFYLAWNKRLDNLLLENIQTERIEDAALAVRLCYKLNPSETNLQTDDDVALIKHYIENDAVGSKRKLDHALKMYLELESERRKVQESVDRAHGKAE